MMANTLKIEVSSRDRTFTTYVIEGLSVDEMNRILNPQPDGSNMDSRLQEILNSHNPGLGDDWRWGYGIYGVKHFGGHLLVTVGNSCE